MPRLEPVHPPYTNEVAERLAAMMPPGVEPLVLFRTFVHNMPMTKAMGPWGGYELSKRLSLSMRDREIIIDRTCARCACEYEWGVHVAFFAGRVGLTSDQVVSLTHGSSTDPCWTSERDTALIDAVDSLHDSATISNDLFGRLEAELTPAEILDVTMMVGWYHAISFTANALEIALEPGAHRFADFEPA